MDRRPPQLPNLPPRPGQPPQPGLPPRPHVTQSALGSGPPLPALDRSVQPPAQPQLTGPQRLDSLESKLAVQRSMVNEIKLIKITALLPCSVHPCLNLTSTAQVGYDLTFQNYRFSPMCPECLTTKRP